MTKKTKSPRLSDKDLRTLARQFGAAPFRQMYSDAEPAFRQCYSDGPMAALLIIRHNRKSRRRRTGGDRDEG